MRLLGFTVCLCTFLLTGTVSFCQQRTRFTYAVKDTQLLWMDDYRPLNSNGITVLFVHGGAFTTGHPGNQRPMAEGLNALGYRVLVMKYRLYLQGKDFGCGTETSEKLKAIHYAVEDIEDATAYLLQHADSLQLDSTKLFLSGSSAGAEAALNAVFNPFKSERRESAKRFSAFQFAGLMSFAGAVLDINLITKKSWVPLLLMHGTADALVPYNTGPHRFCTASDKGWMMFFGSESIYKKALQFYLPVQLYSFTGAGHEVSNYMFRKFREMDVFMQAVIHKKIKPAHTVLPSK